VKEKLYILGALGCWLLCLHALPCFEKRNTLKYLYAVRTRHAERTWRPSPIRRYVPFKSFGIVPSTRIAMECNYTLHKVHVHFLLTWLAVPKMALAVAELHVAYPSLIHPVVVFIWPSSRIHMELHSTTAGCHCVSCPGKD
jgi:hypothetical protein